MYLNNYAFIYLAIKVLVDVIIIMVIIYSKYLTIKTLRSLLNLKYTERGRVD